MKLVSKLIASSQFPESKLHEKYWGFMDEEGEEMLTSYSVFKAPLN